jgi:predicted transposase/invertase (TIGR01784 family)
MSARMLYTWSSIYHSQISKGNDFAQLKPVISIWILNESLFDNVDDFHLPFVLYNQKNKLVLSKDIEIHLLQLPKWQSPQIKTEKERWIYLFKEGKNVDVDVPPEALNTDEMRQAMEVLNRFSENQEDYLLYQSRLDAILKENTYVNEIARVKMEMGQVKEQARKEKEQARKREEQVQARLDSLLLQLKEKGMDDVVAEVSKEK